MMEAGWSPSAEGSEGGWKPGEADDKQNAREASGTSPWGRGAEVWLLPKLPLLCEVCLAGQQVAPGLGTWGRGS